MLLNTKLYEPLTSAQHQYETIAKAIEYLYEHFREQPDLEEVAAQVHVSPFHFQRMFTDWAGISPKRFMQFLTADYLKQRMRNFTSIADAADDAGLSSQSRVYDLFVTLEGVTPQEYKESGGGITIAYGFHATPFGEVIIGATNRGICHLHFVPDGQHQMAIAQLQASWENAVLLHQPQRTAAYVETIFHSSGKNEKLHVLVKGTNFQVKVWNALLKIPAGTVTTYQDVAREIGSPRAMQAVGSAVGANPVGFLIPCHRVIRKNGALAEYLWGPERKKAILGWELSRGIIVPETPIL
ncbi:methylated-DNA--[protein]-cysteine S-methyltransferase [Pseudoflavitalea sp. G-6-1-2]|uniref:methylated-DNA--[protein]-cysteine S-methyltransferase n=1 Tax=Pseudoflavitalea sp. G-6-1-2 TaxID=2728841 RepID=UPI00146D4A84|nr:methylated-DNA--[protein]-cysteine S-methyltransferase [Pseudoflavitalea sp. G-6-1-2]NML22505.1 methylated-DNA--[protein]-cysteine S-methyltransferase [Pseudoflavitalea sp. G-6-1-2]